MTCTNTIHGFAGERSNFVITAIDFSLEQSPAQGTKNVGVAFDLNAKLAKHLFCFVHNVVITPSS